MRKLFLIISTILFYSLLYAQNEVLMPGIDGKYTGETKKGLAHGEGEAIGKDSYKGKFKKGLPHGKGTYTWQTGEVFQGVWNKGLKEGSGKYVFKTENGDSVIAGYWYKDIFIGDKPRPEPEYKILEKKNIERVMFVKQSEQGNQIIIKISTKRGGAYDFIAFGSSGVLKESNYLRVCEFVEFPYEGTIKYSVLHIFVNGLIYCRLNYKIIEPGTWVINLYH